MAASPPPLPSPSSDQRFWNTLRGRVETLLENRNPAALHSSPVQIGEGFERRNRLKEDSMLLLRGFDSVAQSLSQLSNNLETALQGARDLGRPTALTEIVDASIQKKAKTEGEEEVDKRGLKRKLDSEECSENQEKEEEEKGKCAFKFDKIKKAKNLAMSMATKAATMARELKSIRSDLSFMQERCGMLEEENRKLRDGLETGEDDLVRLQLEALLAEKSRLASENADLKRENQCLHQLVEYHQVTSEDLSASYENLVRGMGLNFDCDLDDMTTTPSKMDFLGFAKSLDECFDDDEQD